MFAINFIKNAIFGNDENVEEITIELEENQRLYYSKRTNEFYIQNIPEESEDENVEPEFENGNVEPEFEYDSESNINNEEPEKPQSIELLEEEQKQEKMETDVKKFEHLKSMWELSTMTKFPENFQTLVCDASLISKNPLMHNDEDRVVMKKWEKFMNDVLDIDRIIGWSNEDIDNFMNPKWFLEILAYLESKEQ